MTYCSNCGANNESGTIYCFNCGTKVEISVQSPPQPERYIEEVEVPQYTSNNGRLNKSTQPKRVLKSKAGKIFAIVLIVLVVSSGASFFGSSVPFDIQEDRIYTYGSEEIPAELTFTFDVSSAEIVFQFNSSPIDDIIKIEANFDFKARGIEECSLEEFYDIVWETSGTSVLFGVYQKEWFHWAMWDQSIITVTLRDDIMYDLDIDTGSGSISVDVPEGVNFSNLNIHTGSGSIYLDLNGSSIISNDLNIGTGSGNIHVDIKNTTIKNSLEADTGSGSLDLVFNDVDLSNTLNLDTGSGNMVISILNSKLSNGISSDTGSGSVRYELTNTTLGGDFNVEIGSGCFTLISEDITLLNNINWDIDGGSGNVNIVIIQHHTLGGLITGDIETGSGGVTVNLDMDSILVPSNWECDVGSGDVSFNLENPIGYNYMDETLTSQSFDGTTGFDLFLETGSGNIDINN